MAVCPTQAISIAGADPEALEPVARKDAIAREDLVRHVKSRRSIRTFKDAPVERGLLEELVDAVRWAPTAKNFQPVHWTLVNDPATMRELAGLVVDWLRETGADPGVVRFFDKGHDPVLRGAPALAAAHTDAEAIMPVEDCAIAATTMDALAPTFGLGATWAGYFMWAAKQYEPLQKRLALPEGHTVYAALMLGHPRLRYARIPPREPARINWI
jgi:nitroreductase